jgi:hypothetical protein
MEPFLDAVLLVPGLLGFNRFASFSYFADRVVTALRVGIESHVRRPVLVVPVSTLPAAPLAQRQTALFENIAELRRRFSTIERVHLVGHSTGGLDAYLAIGDGGLSVGFKTARDVIRSVVTLAAPLLGTCLVDHDAIRLLAGRLGAVAGSVDLLKLALSLRKQLTGNVTTDDAMAGFIADPSDGLRYAWELVRHRELILELSPANIARLRRDHRRTGDHVPVTCFATWTPVDPKRNARSATLFTRLQAMTASSDMDSDDPLIATNIELLKKGPVFGARPLSEIDAQSNDGIVNTVRQLVPARGSVALSSRTISTSSANTIAKTPLTRQRLSTSS